MKSLNHPNKADNEIHAFEYMVAVTYFSCATLAE